MMFDPQAAWEIGRQHRNELLTEAANERRARSGQPGRPGRPGVTRRGRSRRREVLASSPWERTVGASSAVQMGSVIEVSGTGAVTANGKVLYPGDPYLQATEALTLVGESLEKLGAGLQDVIRTRVYLKKAWQWELVGRAHGDVFGEIRPATTFVGAGAFVDPDILVEIEATALVSR